jgi:malonyl-ACP O-methyltransferase BioC
MPNTMNVFDRRIVRMRRDRAARGFEQHDFLVKEVGKNLADRLNDVKRAFPLALDLGCHTGDLSRLLIRREDVGAIVSCDLSPAMAARAPDPRVVADEEALPFRDGTFDLVMSLLSLHWVNDLPGALTQIRMALKPDGLFLGALLGGQTLKELRQTLTEAEIAIEGGLSPRVSPFTDVRDAGDLLQRAGFALPVVDSETITVMYTDPLKLIADLRGMGETNAVLERRKGLTRRGTLFEAMGRYRDTFETAEGGFPATFQVIYVIGWSPDASQPKPLRRGTAKSSLADVLKVRPES